MAGEEKKLISTIGLLVREIRCLLTVISETKTREEQLNAEIEALKERLEGSGFEAFECGLPERIDKVEEFLKLMFPKRED